MHYSIKGQSIPVTCHDVASRAWQSGWGWRGLLWAQLPLTCGFPEGGAGVWAVGFFCDCIVAHMLLSEGT